MIPGLRGSDHIGITVPDMDAAHDFFVRVLGADHVYSLPGKDGDDDWMQRQLDVHPRTKITEIRFYRLGNGSNFEVFTYGAADGQADMPRNSDIGGHHVALYVDDMDAAVAHASPRGRGRARRAHRFGRPCGRPALGLLHGTLGHVLRARQLPDRQVLRDRSPCEALAPRASGRIAV